jgi:hypothetical protein
MNNNSDLKLSENVLIIDTFILNALIQGIKKIYDEKLTRELGKIDIANLLDYLALDMGLRPGNNEIMVFFVSDEESSKIYHCVNSDIDKELDQMTFTDKIGTFNMFSAPTKGLVGRKDLFNNILDIVLNSKDVKRLAVFPQTDENGYESEIEFKLESKKDIDIIEFNVIEASAANIKKITPIYAIMLALGIQDDEVI